MSDTQSLHSDWLSDILKSELLISENEFLADADKSEHSFLRNLLNDRDMSDSYEVEGIHRTDNDVFFDNTTMSAKSCHFADDCSQSSDLTEHSDSQTTCSESSTVVKPAASVEKGSKRSALHCQILRMNSIADRSFVDDPAENLLKTPAGFYDRSCTTSCLSIPPLFDYSSGLFGSPSHISDASYSLSSRETSPLCSITEDEKWSEGSEILSVDIDSSSSSALSPSDVTEDGLLSIAEEEDRLSEQEERVVLSVVQNVLSDEAVTLGSDDSEINESRSSESCCDEHRLSPEVPSSENSLAANSCQLLQSSVSDMSKLNPLARPFRCVPKLSLQPVPVVFTPSMPTVVVPIKFAYTKLVPVATSKSPSPKCPEKKNVHQTSRMVLSSHAPSSE